MNIAATITLGAALGVLLGIGGVYLGFMYGNDSLVAW